MQFQLIELLVAWLGLLVTGELTQQLSAMRLAVPDCRRKRPTTAKNSCEEDDYSITSPSRYMHACSGLGEATPPKDWPLKAIPKDTVSRAA